MGPVDELIYQKQRNIGHEAEDYGQQGIISQDVEGIDQGGKIMHQYAERYNQEEEIIGQMTDRYYHGEGSMAQSAGG